MKSRRYFPGSVVHFFGWIYQQGTLPVVMLNFTGRVSSIVRLRFLLKVLHWIVFGSKKLWRNFWYSAQCEPGLSTFQQDCGFDQPIYNDFCSFVRCFRRFRDVSVFFTMLMKCSKSWFELLQHFYLHVLFEEIKDTQDWNSPCSPYSTDYPTDITSQLPILWTLVYSLLLYFKVFVNSWTVSLDHAKVHARTSRIRCWRSFKRKRSVDMATS